MTPKYWRYVLQLQHGCYYVGTTTNPERRMEQHATGEGAHWTTLHPFIAEIERKELDSGHLALDDETRRAAELMLIHGVNRVRGGMFILKPPKELYTLDDVENLVTSIGHCLEIDMTELTQRLRNDVTLDRGVAPTSAAPIIRTFQPHVGSAPVNIPMPRQLMRGRAGTNAGPPIQRSFQPPIGGVPKRPRVIVNCCTRCGRTGHSTSKCFATTYEDGRPIGKSYDSDDDSSESDDDTCHRCGRTGHWANECYAKTSRGGKPF